MGRKAKRTRFGMNPKDRLDFLRHTILGSMTTDVDDTDCSWASEATLKILQSLMEPIAKQPKNNFREVLFVLREHVGSRIRDDNCYIYEVGLTLPLARGGGNRTTNHWFIIIQCGDKLLLCDAFTEIHRYCCREIDIGWLDRLFVSLTRAVEDHTLPKDFWTFFEGPKDDPDFEKEMEELRREGVEVIYKGDKGFERFPEALQSDNPIPQMSFSVSGISSKNFPSEEAAGQAKDGFGRRKVHFGSRGGRYIIKKGRKKYV